MAWVEYLTAVDRKAPAEISAKPSAFGESLWLEQDDDMIELDRKQLEQLSKVIDRFLDK